MDGENRVGTRVAALRRARGYTQRELARRAHVSYSLVTKVEGGHAPASPAFIAAVARALRVDVPQVIGQPFPEEGHGRAARLHATVDPIRRALHAFDAPPEDVLPRPADDLRVDVARLSDLGRQANYIAIGETVPSLLDELSAAIHAAPDADRPRLFTLLAEAYSGASAVANLLGYLDLRDRVIDRIDWASRNGDDPLRPLRVRWQRSASLMAGSAYAQGLALMERTRRDLGEDLTHMEAPVLSLYGSMCLRSAILAARAAKTEGTDRARQAWGHLDVAREAAEVMGRDRDDYGLAFGPSNVTQHEVAVAVELEEGAEAVERGRKARLGPTVPKVRAGHHYIDLARGYLLHGDHRGALRCLQRARRAAPQQTRHHPMVRETVLAIASARRRSDELARFSSWLGLTD